MKGSALWLGASLAALAWAAPATAQDAAPQTTASDTATTDDVEGDIIITATRRDENLMTSPISASVLSGTDLGNKGVTNVDALQFAMPSVVVNNFGQGNDFNVRGIGKAEHNTQTTTGVITYRDGVPTFPGYFQMEPYYDVANIQVLRGPQGTIVGQNATGGAVFVNTNDPIINGGMRGYVNANYGNYNDFGFQGAVNIPISNTFAMRVAGFAQRRDSFFKIRGAGGTAYPYDNGKMGYLAGRVSFLWKPTENFSALWKTDLDFLDSGAYPASPFYQHSSFYPTYKRDLYNIELNAPQDARDKFVRSVLKLEYDTSSGIKFRSVSGYQTGNTMYRADLDGTASNFGDPTTIVLPTNPTGTIKNYSFYDNVNETQFSQEFNIISPDNKRFTWLIGGFGMWNTYYFPKPFSNFTINACYPFTTIAACLYQLAGRNPERNLAAFGQVGFQITPNLKIELGGRYTASRSTNYVNVLQYGLAINQVQKVSSDNFSYKASLGWKVSNDQYLYGFVATGFRPGGLNVPVSAATIQPFKPERITSYEAGWKANWAGGHVRTTITGFYNDYKDFQVIIGYPTFPTFGIELNVPNSTKIYGGEGEIDVSVGGFKFGAGVNVLHTELGQFYASDPRAPATGACDPLKGGAAAATNCINLKGRRQTYAPNLTFNFSAEYTLKLPGGDTITPRANFGYVGNQWATLFENPARGDRLDARKILNAQLAYTHGTLTVTAYATNLTDQHYVAALNSGLYFAGAPRQYGLKVLKVF
ncbi:TonB-dependent receptor [Sphingomonas panacisoli]|uniref:TonB-dependent receptor n=1 Tax=Sphingomonas panacisoli TaxID=1813879 RepID=A0A5B8LH61_9SPHN|nr:TonB-dependent receptor [Sphingomonas panacisoli]QDZ06954.1 TonB-dependent receptor [Sphingomonas panacisoli]